MRVTTGVLGEPKKTTHYRWKPDGFAKVSVRGHYVDDEELAAAAANERRAPDFGQFFGTRIREAVRVLRR